MGAAQRKELIKQIQEKRGNSRLICCLTSDRENAQGQIAKDFLFRFFQHLRKMENLEKLDVLLFTLGGDTLAAYALARLVRQFAKTVGVLIPFWCHSSGTLFALSADEIVMTRLGTLSSIDPSIMGALNPTAEIAVPGMPVGVPGQKIPVPVGVESVAGFKRLVRDVWRLDEDGTGAAFNLLSEKVHPLLLGDLQRSKEQIVQLATTLLKLRAARTAEQGDRRKSDPDRIAKIVEMLASNFGSHDYLVGKTEAREEVHLPIADDNEDLENLVLSLYEDFAEEMELGTPFDPFEGVMVRPGQAVQPVSKIAKMVVIESLERSDVWERELLVIPPNQVQMKRNHWRK